MTHSIVFIPLGSVVQPLAVYKAGRQVMARRYVPPMHPNESHCLCTMKVYVLLYLRELSSRGGHGEGIGNHRPKYVQVIVALACASGAVVS